LQCAFAENSRRQQKIEPDQARIMRLERQADREARDANRHKPLAKKAPDGHHARLIAIPAALPVIRSDSLLARRKPIRTPETIGA